MWGRGRTEGTAKGTSTYRHLSQISPEDAGNIMRGIGLVLPIQVLPILRKNEVSVWLLVRQGRNGECGRNDELCMEAENRGGLE